MTIQKATTREGRALELVNLLEPKLNKLYEGANLNNLQNLSATELKTVTGEFAITRLVQDDQWVWKGARTIGVPARVAVQILSPKHSTRFIVGHTIKEIREEWYSNIPPNTYLKTFDPSFTRMIPAFEILSIKPDVMGDNEFEYEWFLSGQAHARSKNNELFPPDIRDIGTKLVETTLEVVRNQVETVPDHIPLSVSLSGGTDSTLVLIALLQVLRELGRSNVIYAHTLAIDGGGTDLAQAEQVVVLAEKFFGSNSPLKFTPIHTESQLINKTELSTQAAELAEEYHIRDIECVTASILLNRGLYDAHTTPSCKYEWNGDGGNELFEDYPLQDSGYGLIGLEEVWEDPHLYLLGYPRTKRAYSLTFSGGLSRAYTRTFNPARSQNTISFSTLIDRRLVELGQRLPLKQLAATPEQLYALRGEVVRTGLKSVLGIEIPIFPKARFQNGSAKDPNLLNTSQAESSRLKNLILRIRG